MVLSWRSETGAHSKLFQICAHSRSDCDDTITALELNSQLYGATEVCLYRRLTLLLHDWQNLSATLAQLRVGGFSRFSPAPIHEGPGDAEHWLGGLPGDASTGLRACHPPCLLAAKGSSDAPNAARGGFEDKKPPSGTSRKSAAEPVVGSTFVGLFSTVVSSWGAG